MKKFILLILLASALFGCEKVFLVPKNELPQWLIESIKYDEKTIESGEKSNVDTGSWTRTEWNDEYYYEYFNGLSSSLSKVRSHNGDTLDIFVTVGTSYTPYHKEKCCSICVWKGPYGMCLDQQ